MVLIKKSKYYKVGVCSITDIVGKEKKLEFDKGEEIEATEEQFQVIDSLEWCIKIEDINGNTAIS